MVVPAAILDVPPEVPAFDMLVDAAPPPPTVIVIDEPAVTVNPDAVNKPPAPPPPAINNEPSMHPPPPPPATIRYSIVGVGPANGLYVAELNPPSSVILIP
jgi:hypothetical protein